MAEKEARARIKINQLLQEAGWRFFDSPDSKSKANILLENHTKITALTQDAWGDDFEKSQHGYIDFLLLDKLGFPFIVLEAKAGDKNPLFGKEQARQYARAQHCRFIILSNGNLHYFWDTERGNPQLITRFPSPGAVTSIAQFKPDRQKLAGEPAGSDYIALTQMPEYASDPSWIDESRRKAFIKHNKLRFLRPYQLAAIQSIQSAVRQGKDRFLFEMATGTGKTLVAAAVIKLFLRTGNARRILFLVDRLELEDQAAKAFRNYLKNDYHTVIYKENRDDWRKAEIVVSTIQTFLAKNRYMRLFAADDFDLVISDEAHRSIGGNSRAVFEYFIGAKLGLTATPRDYLKNLDTEAAKRDDPRELERRILLDTYKTFGCENGVPTFRYSLIDGVREGYLVNPLVVDARTDITTQLLSEEGYAVQTINEEGEEVEESYLQRDFERRFFSEETNRVFCSLLLTHALRDPVSGEMGKTIVFCVSQNHAARITQLLNEEAERIWPGRYRSDFAIQVTSRIPEAQQFAINFANNKLSGAAHFNPAYKTSKSRVCVTVGMMTTGYDCTDLLNLALMRPVFSPTDFIQIKGRGTRIHDFSEEVTDPEQRRRLGPCGKERFKLFDFFANCEYFEEKFNYDEVLAVPMGGTGGRIHEPPQPRGGYESSRPDFVARQTERMIGEEGMKIDRMYFQKFEERLKADPIIAEKLEKGEWDALLDHLERHILNRPEEYFTLEKLRAAFHVDRRIPMREIIEKVFGMIPYFKSRNEVLDDEFDKFDSRYMPQEEYFDYARAVFKAYVLDAEFRGIVDSGNFALLNVNPSGEAFQRLPEEWRKRIPEYIKDNVPLNQFAA